MEITALLLSFIGVFVFTVIGSHRAYADESYLVNPVVSYSDIRFNNDNWDALPHPTIAQFSLRKDGSAYGITVTGIPFIQFNVPNGVGVRVQRFEMQDHYHYIVDGEIAATLEELSTKLSLAYTSRQGT